LLGPDGPLPYDDDLRKFITIQSFLNENIDGAGSKKYLSEVRLCTREDYERVDSGQVWDDLQT